MKSILTRIAASALFLSSLGSLSAQTDCSSGRYIAEVFPNVDVTTNIQYGSNLTYTGANSNLTMDIFEPQGDPLALRPLIVWAHGGSFVGGTKEGTDVVPLCQTFARMGYVTASINYRIGMTGIPFPGPTDSAATEAVLRGVHDAKAAVRWFYKDAATNGNAYGIDTNRIIIAGVSAGGFISLHYSYLDEMSEFPSWVDTTNPGLGGGLQGNSGNPGYSEKVIACVNVAGALGDTAWVHAGDEPLVSLHGDQDGTVPYGTAMLSLLGVFPIIEVDGSSSIHARAQHVGLDDCFYTYIGADHVPHVGNQAYTDTTVAVIAHFLLNPVCGSGGTCGYTPLASARPSLGNVSVFPNPTEGRFTLRLPEASQVWEARLFDLNGREVMVQNQLLPGDHSLDVSSLPAGMYLLKARTGNQETLIRIALQ